ncbi:MAG: ribonuclease H family protein [Bacillota bacterium]
MNKYYKFKLKIIKNKENLYLIKVYNPKNYIYVKFNYQNRNIDILSKNDLAIFFKRNKYQLSKILRNIRKSSLYKDFQIPIVIKDKKDVSGFNNKENIIALDRLDNKYKTYVVETVEKEIIKVYSDGSYQEKIKSAGFSYIIKYPNKEYELVTKKSKLKSSSLIELEAVLDALNYLESYKNIRIISDSQYVKKGATEWLPIWLLNDWKTVNGKTAKNKKYWLKLYKLTKDKYIEFKWVKAHSNHFENELADLYAKDISKNK